MHVGSRSSTQARSHAQKFFVKLEKRGQRLDDFLRQIDLEGVRQRMMEAGSDQDYEDPDNYCVPVQKMGAALVEEEARGEQLSLSVVRPAQEIIGNKS